MSCQSSPGVPPISAAYPYHLISAVYQCPSVLSIS
ncbi:unnamed protein product, partial [Staurois parvus]